MNDLWVCAIASWCSSLWTLSFYVLLFLPFSIYTVLYVDQCNLGIVQHTVCFLWVCTSTYLWIVFFPVVFTESSTSQRNVGSSGQISPWGNKLYHIILHDIVSCRVMLYHTSIVQIYFGFKNYIIIHKYALTTEIIL